MMNGSNTEKSGIGAVDGRKRRYRISFLITLGGALLGGFMVKAGLEQKNDLLSIAALLVLAGAGLLGMYFYHRSIDEHEKEALFWANSAGVYTLVMAGMASLVLRTLSDPVMISIQNMLLAGAAAAVIAWFWKKYR